MATNLTKASWLVAASTLFALPAAAQPFEAGPPGTVVGSSMAHMPLRGMPELGTPTIPNAHVFGDTVEERAWGRDYDDSHLHPKIRRPPPPPSTVERAYEGRSTLDDARAGVFATEGPDAIGGSSVTRPALGTRR